METTAMLGLLLVVGVWVGVLIWLAYSAYDAIKGVVKAMNEKRYVMQHGRRGGYCVVDVSTRGKVVMFASGSKRDAIAEAQRLNKFTIVDGREDTYERQMYKAKMED